jgi:hypothetical protein
MLSNGKAGQTNDPHLSSHLFRDKTASIKIYDKDLNWRLKTVISNQLTDNKIHIWNLTFTGTGKVVPVLFSLSTMPWRCIGEWRYSSTHSLTPALQGVEWSASRTGHFTPRERAPGTHWIGSWVGPKAILDMLVKRKIASPHWESNPTTLMIWPIA